MRPTQGPEEKTAAGGASASATAGVGSPVTDESEKRFPYGHIKEARIEIVF